MAQQLESFNSATAVTPWVTFVNRRTQVVSVASFNSATAVTPWVTAIGLSEKASPSCFNSATAVTPWVTSAATTEVAKAEKASIRPRR